MSTLTELRDRVEQTLADVSNAIWSTAGLDEALRQALAEYSAAVPRRLNTTLALSGLLSANGREIDIADMVVVDILAVHAPYLAGDVTACPRAFEFWRDCSVIHLTDTTAQSTDTARIFYTATHVIGGLDDGLITTVRPEHETLLVGGAAALAALSRAVDLTEQVTVSNQTVQEVRLWGEYKLREFRAALRQAQGQAASGPPWVALPALDRWDK